MYLSPYIAHVVLIGERERCRYVCEEMEGMGRMQ
jgi:hypothetical protein